MFVTRRGRFAPGLRRTRGCRRPRHPPQRAAEFRWPTAPGSMSTHHSGSVISKNWMSWFPMVRHRKDTWRRPELLGPRWSLPGMRPDRRRPAPPFSTRIRERPAQASRPEIGDPDEHPSRMRRCCQLSVQGSHGALGSVFAQCFTAARVDGGGLAFRAVGLCQQKRRAFRPSCVILFTNVCRDREGRPSHDRHHDDRGVAASRYC